MISTSGSKSYDDMTDSEIKEAVKQIVSTSTSEDEVRRRVTDELGYPYDVAIISHIPEDPAGEEAREIVGRLGGLVMKNGAMAMVMLHGHNGTISF